MAKPSAKQAPDNNEPVTESQQALAVFKFLKEPPQDKEGSKKLREQVQKDQRELSTLLQARLRKAEKAQSRHREDVSDLIAQAFRPPNFSIDSADDDFPSYPGTAIALNTMYASAEDVLSSSKRLVAEYDRMERMINDATQDGEEPVMETWKQEVKETERLLEVGRRKALRDVKKVLGADVEDDRMDGIEGSGRVIEERMDSNEKESSDTLNYELLKSLRYAERGVKRMVKGLPKNDASI